MDAVVVAFAHSDLGVPAIGLNLAKEFVVLHHARTSRAVVVQGHKTPIAKALRKVRNVFGQDVRVDVNHQG